MLRVTDEIREAALRLLDRHNAAEAGRIEARYQRDLALAQSLAERVGRQVNEGNVRARAASEHWSDKQTRQRLEAITSGKRKEIDDNWWITIHGVVDQAKIDKLAALADPERNPNEHERKVATTKLASAKARRPPGSKPLPQPLPSIEELKARVEEFKSRRTGKRKQPKPHVSDSVARLSSPSRSAPAHDRKAKLRDLNAKRASKRAEDRSGLTCQHCGKPLSAQRPTARFCGPTCRFKAWRGR